MNRFHIKLCTNMQTTNAKRSGVKKMERGKKKGWDTGRETVNRKEDHLSRERGGKIER